MKPQLDVMKTREDLLDGKLLDVSEPGLDLPCQR